MGTKLVTIEEISQFIRNGLTVKQDKTQKLGCPITRIETISKGIIDIDSVGYANLNLAENQKWLLNYGDILISHINSPKHLGKSAFYDIDTPLIHGMNLLNLRANEKIYPKFLFYFLHTENYFRQIHKIMKKSVNQASFSLSGFRIMQLPLPPIVQQKAITQKLDKAQELIELRKSSIKKLDELSKALFVDMFGDPVENKMGWEVVKLKEILITIDGGWSPVCENYPRENTNNAVLKLSALNNNTYHQLENKTMKENCEPKLQTMVKKRDLLFSRKNTFMLVGSCAYVFETEANLFLPDLIFRLNPTDKINSIYLWKYLTNDNVKIGIRNLSNGAAASMPNISKAKLLDFKVKLPPLPLQQKFAKTIEKIEAQKALYEEELKGFEDLFESLLSESFA